MLRKYGHTLLNNTIYSIAAFEVDEGAPPPDTKDQLMDSIERGVVRPVHVKIAVEAMGATKYSKWYTATEPYPIKYEPHYEPYVLVHKSIIP